MEMISLYTLYILSLYQCLVLSLDCDISFQDKPDKEWDHFGTHPCSTEWCFDAAGTQWPEQNLDYHYRECDKVEWCKTIVKGNDCVSGAFHDISHQLVFTGTVCCCNTSDGCNRHLPAWKQYNQGGSQRKLLPQPFRFSDKDKLVEIKTTSNDAKQTKKDDTFEEQETSKSNIIPIIHAPILITAKPIDQDQSPPSVPHTLKDVIKTSTPIITQSRTVVESSSSSPPLPTSSSTSTAPSTVVIQSSTSTSPQPTTELSEPPTSPVLTTELGEPPTSPVITTELGEPPTSPVITTGSSDLPTSPVITTELGEPPTSPIPSSTTRLPITFTLQSTTRMYKPMPTTPKPMLSSPTTQLPIPPLPTTSTSVPIKHEPIPIGKAVNKMNLTKLLHPWTGSSTPPILLLPFSGLPPAPPSPRPITINFLNYPITTQYPIQSDEIWSQETILNLNYPDIGRPSDPPLPPAPYPIKPPGHVNVVPSAPQTSGDYIDLSKINFYTPTDEYTRDWLGYTREPIPEKKPTPGPSTKWLETVRQWRSQRLNSHNAAPQLIPCLFLLIVTLLVNL